MWISALVRSRSAYVSAGWSSRTGSSTEAQRSENAIDQETVRAVVSGESRSSFRAHCSTGVGDYASSRIGNRMAQWNTYVLSGDLGQKRRYGVGVRLICWFYPPEWRDSLT